MHVAFLEFHCKDNQCVCKWLAVYHGHMKATQTVGVRMKGKPVTGDEIAWIAEEAERWGGGGGDTFFDFCYFNLLTMLDRCYRNDHARTIQILERMACYHWVIGGNYRVKEMKSPPADEDIFRAIAECPMKQRGNGSKRFDRAEFFRIAARKSAKLVP